MISIYTTGTSYRPKKSIGFLIFLLDENTAGFYAALTLFGKIIGYGLTPITEVIFAFAIKAKKREQNRQLLLATAIFTLASLALTLTYYYGGHWLVPLLSKKEYLSLLPWLPAMAIFGSLQTFNLLFGKQLLSASHPASTIAFFAAMLQSGGILLFHTHFNQIMAVNLTTSRSECRRLRLGLVPIRSYYLSNTCLRARSRSSAARTVEW